MPLALRVDVVTRNFDMMLRDLQSIDPSVEFKTIVVAIALRVVRGAAERTRAASVKDIEANERARTLGREFIGLDGKKYLVSGTGTRGHRNRYPDELWSAIQGLMAANQKRRIAERSAAIGLAKQSWLQVARKLGSEIDVPGYVESANWKGKQYPEDGQVKFDSTGSSFGLTIINSSPIVQFAGGKGALLGAMQGEVGYFRQNMAHGFYTTAARRAAKYPGIFVTES